MGATPSPGRPRRAAATQDRHFLMNTETPRTDPGGVTDAGIGDERPTSALLRAINLVAILLPLVGLVAAIVLLWPFGMNWVPLGLLAVMYALTGLGVTVGYHRLFTHKSFETGRVMTFIIGVLGSMSVEGSILSWVANHRKHHQHSDQEHDPHSPHTHGGGVWNMFRGMVHAHMGWFVTANHPDRKRYVPDLEKDKLVKWLSLTFPIWVLAGLLIPAVAGGLLMMSWKGALLGFIWGGLVRILLVHHVTWSVNSVCHVWGSKPFKSNDESRNNVICGVLAMGEGWHNNHHAFPKSAKHGLAWWQFDLSYMVIKAMAMVGLARNIRVPGRARIEAKRRQLA
ncbi:MAG: stearoyl-CoA 9-desaturase [Phycisphaeraceae bacterium]|nr:MAG: stearoyl-CoA 9-desaturase [Phycisphaeraceae bacterium]